MDDFEAALTGGHPNSLGRTDEVAEVVVSDRSRFEDLYRCFFSDDEVVRLRTASALKRVTMARPQWVAEIVDDLQTEIAAIDQASTQWTLALIFDLLKDRLSVQQHTRAVEIMDNNLTNHDDWIVLNNCMKVLGRSAKTDPELRPSLLAHAHRLAEDDRNSVVSNARKLITQLAE